MKLSKLTTARPTSAAIDVLGETVNVTYDRAKINGALWKIPRWREQLAALLLSWDITNDDGAPLAADTAAGWLTVFEPIPDDALLPIYYGVLDDYRGEKKVSSGSAAT